MSRETSPGAGKPYGLERVCQVLEFPRSTIYAQQTRETNVVPWPPVRRGPKPKISDTDLLAAILADLEASPFVGEGHRKVWARLRILRDLRVSKDRVCRLMRENARLSPHRVPQGMPMRHDGSIRTGAPNLRGAPTVSASRPSRTAGCGCPRQSITSMPAASAFMPSRSAIASRPCSRSQCDETLIYEWCHSLWLDCSLLTIEQHRQFNHAFAFMPVGELAAAIVADPRMACLTPVPTKARICSGHSSGQVWLALTDDDRVAIDPAARRRARWSASTCAYRSGRRSRSAWRPLTAHASSAAARSDKTKAQGHPPDRCALHRRDRCATPG